MLTDFRTIFVFALGPFLKKIAQNIQNDPFGAFWGLPKMALGCPDFGHFPIEIPIKAEKTTTMGRKGPRAKTKIVLKSVSKIHKLGCRHDLKLQTFLNKNPPSSIVSDDIDHFLDLGQIKLC